MREIKFKMWNKEEKKMYEVGQIVFQKETAYMKNWWSYTQSFFPFSMIELLQYTGLKDRNDKELYEGDIVKFRFKNDRPECKDLIGFIEYHTQYCAFKIVSSPLNGAFKIDDEVIIEVIRKHIRKSRVIRRRIEMLKIKERNRFKRT